EKLDAQLDDQARQFLQNAQKGLRLKRNEIDLSKIFDWFEDDFDNPGGVINFIRKYRNDLPLKVAIDDYMPYNWNLNKQ
ncbi:MAG: DUF547 domain-containing protein, partial [Gammaproteobacteria bacterium]|nr:DUF547 domain-containing protein [Gammaproteobacteria bacterium]